MVKSYSHFILASESPARKRLLARVLGSNQFDVHPAHLNEIELAGRILKKPVLATTKLTLAQAKKICIGLAVAKAEAVKAQVHKVEGDPRALVIIAGDQLLFFPGQGGAGLLLGKPKDLASAEKMLKKCAGKRVQLVTALAVGTKKKMKLDCNVTTLDFAKGSDDLRRRVVALDQPISCAGAFKFELHGIALFDRVRTDDPTAIEGLPTMALRRLLLGLGRYSFGA